MAAAHGMRNSTLPAEPPVHNPLGGCRASQHHPRVVVLWTVVTRPEATGISMTDSLALSSRRRALLQVATCPNESVAGLNGHGVIGAQNALAVSKQVLKIDHSDA